MKVDYELQKINCRDCRGTGQSRNGPDLRCEYCGGNGWVETYSARRQRLTQPAPETGEEWRYDETHGAHVAIDDKFQLRAHWKGTAGSAEVKAIMQQIISDHRAVPLLRDTLQLVRRLLVNQQSCEQSLCCSCEDTRQTVMESIVAVLATVGREGEK